MKKLTLSVFALVAVGGCDLATDVAGDMVADEVRTRYIEQCQGIAESAGITSERIGSACECSADTFQEDLAADGQLDINPDRVEEVLRICMQDDAEVVPVEG